MKNKQIVITNVDEVALAKEHQQMDAVVDKLLDWLGLGEDDDWNDESKLPRAMKRLAKLQQLTPDVESIEEGLARLDELKEKD